MEVIIFLVRGMKWTTTSQYGALREYSLESGHLKVIYSDVFYCSYTHQIGTNHIIAIDPEGGPYLGIGTTISNGDHAFVIRSILSEKNDRRNKKVTVLLDVNRVQ